MVACGSVWRRSKGHRVLWQPRFRRGDAVAMAGVDSESATKARIRLRGRGLSGERIHHGGVRRRGSWIREVHEHPNGHPENRDGKKKHSECHAWAKLVRLPATRTHSMGPSVFGGTMWAGAFHFFSFSDAVTRLIQPELCSPVHVSIRDLETCRMIISAYNIMFTLSASRMQFFPKESRAGQVIRSPPEVNFEC